MRLEPPYDPTDGRDYIRRDTSSVSARMHFADSAAVQCVRLRHSEDITKIATVVPEAAFVRVEGRRTPLVTQTSFPSTGYSAARGRRAAAHRSRE